MPERKRGSPGARWRLLAQNNGQSLEITDQGLFDELVVDDWLHIEKLDTNRWWMRLGDADIQVEIGEGGRVRVDIERGSHMNIHGTTSVFKPPS